MTKRHKRPVTKPLSAASKKQRAGTVVAKAKPWLFYFFFGYLVLFIPVFYLPQALDRVLAPRLLALALLLLLCVPLLFNKVRLLRWDFSVWRQWVIPLWALFFVVTVVSAFFAVNHMESYLFIVRNFMFATGLAMAALVLHNTPDWHTKLPKLFIIAAGIALIIGFVQYISRVTLAGTDKPDVGLNIVYLVTGMFAHKNFFSSALMLMLPFTAFGIYKYRDNWRWGAILSTAGILILILMLRTRAVWVGLIAAAFVAGIIMIVSAKSFMLSARWRNIIIVSMFAGIAGIFVLFNLGDASDEFSVAGRMRSIFDTQSRHNIHRLFIWNASLEIIQEVPLTGIGSGNWLLHIPKHFHRNFEHLEALGWRQPHNDFLWIAAEKGIPGILIFLAAFALSMYYLLQVIRNKDDDVGVDNDVGADKHHGVDKKVLALLLLAGIIAYLADSFFSFPYERAGIMVFLMIITASAVALVQQKVPKKAFKPNSKLVIAVGVIGLSFSLYYAYSSIMMEKNMAQALGHLNHRNFVQVQHYAHAAKTPLRSLGPHLYPPEFLEGIAFQNQEYYHRAVESFEKARQQAPYDIRILHMLGNNYRRIEKHEEAFHCYTLLVQIYPPSPSILNDMKNLAVEFSELKNYRKAYNLLKSIPGWEDDPEIVRNVNNLQNFLQTDNGAQ